ncbi:site-specific integrase [Candidatus Omnitrophota bacterium]
MFKGEILGLKWQDIDFSRRIIYLLDTKNGEKRELPMNDTVKTALLRTLRHPDSPYVFGDKNGRPFRDIRKSFFTAIRKSGIINFRFHDLRHTFSSHLVMSGVDLNTVRELLGHKSLKMTLRYAHLSPNHKGRAVELLSAKMVPDWSPGIKDKKLQEKEVSLAHCN